ncbi:MAG TPA: response regulator transcription factor [Streptosporangiaceae bacterium]|jgi:DNA-binding NarL/FixJ family response regulator
MAVGEPMTIRVLLVDDDPLVRAGLRLMLRSAPDVDVVGEAGDGAAAITAAADLAPDVILMDIRMPGTDGVTATAAITKAAAAPRVVALTTFDADDLVRQAITAGAVGYLVKDTPPAEIISAVRAVAAGHGVLSPAVTRPLLNLLHEPPATERSRPGLEALTERERAVALAVTDGATNAEIARQLYVSAATVKATVSRILVKLELDNRVQIAVAVRGSRPR